MKQGLYISTAVIGVLFGAGPLQAEETPAIDMQGLMKAGQVVPGTEEDRSGYQSELMLMPDVAEFQERLSVGPDFVLDRATSPMIGSGWADNPFEFGLTYVGSFKERFNVGASVGYVSAEGDGVIDPQAWAVDAQLGFHGLTLSGSYRDGEGERGLLDQGYEAWNFGGGYEVGPWGFAVSYAEDEYDFAAQISETSAYQAGVDYLLPSGIMVGGGVQQIEFDGDLDLDKSDEETVIYMETMISF